MSVAADLFWTGVGVITTMKGNPAFEYTKHGEPCRGVVEAVTNAKKALAPFWGKL